MSEQPDADDRTEDASPMRLQQMRDDGDIALGRELVTFAAFSVGVLTLVAVVPSAIGQLRLIISRASAAAFQPTSGGVSDILQSCGPLFGLFLVVIGAAGLGAFALGAVQTRLQIWPKKLAPDFKRLFQVDKLTKPFKGEFFVDLGLSLLKSSALLVVIGLILRAQIGGFFSAPRAAAVAGPALWGRLLTDVFMASAAVLGALGFIDFVVQRRRFLKKAKMSKEQLKREYKENEGDPLLKQKRRQRQRELAQGRIAVEVPTADAIVVNPTHIAIAIRYERGKDGAPRVVCKGKDARADKIREIAREHNVPIVKDIWLARMLFQKVKVGREVPEEAFQAVATVLAFVYRVTGKSR